MPFATLNGITLPARSCSMQLVRVGERSRAFSGRSRKSARALKREWSIETPPLEPTEARAWRGLLEGEGHVWSFDDATTGLYSAKGQGPSFQSGASLVTPAKYGTRALRLAASTGIIAWRIAGAASAPWSASVWRLESGVWRHYFAQSTGQAWKDGARNDALYAGIGDWLSGNNGSGEAVLSNVSGAAVDYDDFAWFPFLVPLDWPAQVYNAAAAFGGLPDLRMSGDVTGGAMTVQGEVRGSTSISFAGSSGWVTAGEQLELALVEV
jgi:hypothetical protein